MASLSLGSPLICRNAIPKTMQKPRRTPPRFTCPVVVAGTASAEAVVVRRSGNYRPSLWDQNYIQSLENRYAKEIIVQERANLLRQEVKKRLDETEGPLQQLELIDTLQRLGLSYHFDHEITTVLTKIHEGRTNNAGTCNKIEDLHATALEFRLLRQHGFFVSQDVFDDVKNEKSYESFLKGSDDDIKGLLSLYEASYLSTKSDFELKEIRSYSKKRLSDVINKSNTSDEKESCIREMIIRSLEMPYHWRPSTLEARWYIDVYGKRQDMDPFLLEFAKLDFNIVQSFYQEDLKSAFSWWNKTGLKELDFARDRILENYIWNVELFHEPQLGNQRREVAKTFALTTTIDDIYDVYGTVEELELFTEAVRRWDVNLVDELPEYMRVCFLVLYNEVNQTGHDILRHKNFNVIPYLKKAWTDLTSACLIEAKWHKSGYKPTFKEYIENARFSICGLVILIHSYCVLADKISKETIKSLVGDRQPIVKGSATIMRVVNDMGTSTHELARGDVLKSMQCHMHETGGSHTEARDHMMDVISDAWDEMNHEKMARGSSLHPRFLQTAINLGRMSLCMYQYGDGHGFPDSAKTVDRTKSLILDPIPLY
ncbi:PREDICTED: tricyclene synthase, chloroplastic-like [Tarenaya hassleriana]|uniref:tricyclene synthase, chloroplastic-like n=1 Tax=Tarenaya hassleriana TaxID=28532 RepID=UPI00053C4675|nr:PREDICTED: tricyclene synthase, chloroplastic-like [Tarenaya hassleriana]